MTICSFNNRDGFLSAKLQYPLGINPLEMDKHGLPYDWWAMDSDDFSHVNIFPEKREETLKPIALWFFKKTCEIETKILDAKNGRKTKIGKEKIINETDFPVTVLDSTWYTDLVVKGEFGVRGHFALRACGEGRKDRKLVWINPYKKGGYVREAKKRQHE